MRTGPVVLTLLLVAGCGGNGGQDALGTDPTETPTPITTTPPPAATAATATPTPSPRLTGSPTRSSTPSLAPSPTPSLAPSRTRSPRPSPTPADTRPAAHVVFVNTTGATVEGHLGSTSFRLGPGERVGPLPVRPDQPNNNASASVWLAQDKTCGAGGSEGVLVGHRYTARIYAAGRCASGEEAPGIQLVEG